MKKFDFGSTLVKFSGFVLEEKFANLTATYDKMRSKRNRVIYDATQVSQTEVKEAIRAAEKYLKIVRAKIEEENPQLKLL